MSRTEQVTQTPASQTPATQPVVIPPQQILVESVSLSSTSLSLNVGQNRQLTVTIRPDNAANKNVEWSSNNTSVATVSNGNVTALSAGSAVITVKSIDGNKTANCTVTVTQQPTPPPTQQQQPQQPTEQKPVQRTINYSFGSYSGETVNGIPDGQGTMRYTCRVQIAKHGRGTQYAENGDVLTGTWSKGDIANGNLRDRNGNQKAAVLAGRRQSPHNLSNDRCE